jgi:hypothetical protein
LIPSKTSSISLTPERSISLTSTTATGVDEGAGGAGADPGAVVGNNVAALVGASVGAFVSAEVTANVVVVGVYADVGAGFALSHRVYAEWAVERVRVCADVGVGFATDVDAFVGASSLIGTPTV